MNHKDTLKVLALKERLSEIVSSYEDKIADLRADLTLVVEQLNGEIEKLNKEVQSYKDINTSLLERLGESDVVEKE